MDIDDYSRRYAHQYSGEEWFEQVLVRARRHEVLASLARHPHARVLEVGCGLEPLFSHVEAFDAWTVVEPVPEFVTKARELAGARPVKVVQGFLEDVAPTLTRDYEFVAVSSLLHEVPDPRRLLATLRDLSGKETVLHLNVPNVRSFHRLLALEMGLIQDLFEQSEMEKRFQRTTRFDLAKLRKACVDAGFAIVREGTYFVKPFTHRQMEKLVEQKIVDASILEALGRMTKYMPELGCEMFVELRLA